MSGYDINRFVGLENWLSEDLICSICLNVFNNPVITQCGHTFCGHCIRTSIQSNGSICPQCRQQVVTRKRSRSGENTESIYNTNHSINSIISKLKIKCDFEPNGCREVISLSSMATHLKSCDYNLERIRNELNETKQRLSEVQVICNEFIAKHMELKAKNVELELMNQSMSVNYKELEVRYAEQTKALNAYNASNSVVDTNTNSEQKSVVKDKTSETVVYMCPQTSARSKGSTLASNTTVAPEGQSSDNQNSDYMLIRVLGMNGNEIHFRTKSTILFGKVKRSYSEKVGQPVGTFRFLFDSRRINDTDTPDSLQMKHNDIVEVYEEMYG